MQYPTTHRQSLTWTACRAIDATTRQPIRLPYVSVAHRGAVIDWRATNAPWSPSWGHRQTHRVVEVWGDQDGMPSVALCESL